MAVKDGGVAVTKAAIQYRVPEQTLRDRVLGKVNVDCVSSGTSPVLTIDEEAKIFTIREIWLPMDMATQGKNVELATDYALQFGKRPQDKPFTLNWFRRFIVRWPELRILKPHALEQQRAKCTSESVVLSYFVELERVIKKYNLQDKPHLICNVDEKGITKNNSPLHIVSAIDYHPQSVTSGKSQTTTILGCGSTSGYAISPFFVFAGNRLIPELMDGASP